MKISPSRGFISVYLTATIAAACLSGTPLLAQTPQVEVALQARRVVVDQGKEALVPADKAKPGDVIQYEASYHNAGKAPVQHLGAVIPIPVGLALTADSAVPAASEASLDGKAFSPVPLMRAVKNEAGNMENRPVPLTEYRALRWNLAEVAPNSTTTVALRARVSTNKASQ